MTEPTLNPLLEFDRLPRFSAVRAEHVAPALDRLLAEARAVREEVLARRRHSWEDLVAPLEDAHERVARAWSTASHLNSVVSSDEFRGAYNAALPRVNEFFTEVGQDERLYDAYKALAGSAAFAGYEPAQRKTIENALRDFRLSGAELAPQHKRRFLAIETELAALGNRFAENVLDATQGYDRVLTEERGIAGLPESAREMAAQSAEEAGKQGWRATLEGPSYVAFMTFAEDRALREELYQAYVTRASEQGPNAGRWDNSDLMREILNLRREKAALLGFANYAEYALQRRMAKRTDEVLGFLRDLAARARPAASRDLAELQEFARARHGAARLEAWDIPYYSELLRQARYDYSQEDVRAYLPEDRVLAGMFEVVRRLYGVTVAPIPAEDVWHPSVRLFELRDESGAPRARFYVDLYARGNKRGGAWMDECMSRRRRADGLQLPVAHLVCNLSPPIKGRPALFTHDEVTTLFHEFGHGLHHMLTTVDYLSVAGINGVAWDAVELPSQFMENWCWEREALDLIAGHHRSGMSIPPVLFEKMRAAKNFQAGMQFVRQLEFALFDFRLHTDFDPRGGKSIQELLDEVRAEVAVITPPRYNRFQHNFTHIFSGGYAAGYYSYKWAEVLSADAYSRFEERGVFDRDSGREFLRTILEQGGVRDAKELFVEFRGREPSIEPLLRHCGLAA